MKTVLYALPVVGVLGLLYLLWKEFEEERDKVNADPTGGGYDYQGQKPKGFFSSLPGLLGDGLRTLGLGAYDAGLWEFGYGDNPVPSNVHVNQAEANRILTEETARIEGLVSKAEKGGTLSSIEWDDLSFFWSHFYEYNPGLIYRIENLLLDQYEPVTSSQPGTLGPNLLR